jgi:uncharacterized protein YigE (DUF2233 family)
MLRMRNNWRVAWLAVPLLLAMLSGCNWQLTAAPTPHVPTLTATSRPVASATAPVADTGWQMIAPGVEHRIWRVVSAGADTETLHLLRLDPAQTNIEILYSPGNPRSFASWAEESQAVAIINAGFFTPSYEATGLIVSNGVATGASYEGFGGMFAISDAGPEVRWLAEKPYTPGEPLDGAVQSFPMLLKPGGSPGYEEPDLTPSRRTVVAQDTTGRILFLVASQGAFTLHELSAFLAASDLALDTALNLDGGSSSGFWLRGSDLGVLPLSPLPAVIAVFTN